MREACFVTAVLAGYLVAVFLGMPDGESFTARVAFLLAVALQDGLIVLSVRLARKMAARSARAHWALRAQALLLASVVLLHGGVLFRVGVFGSDAAKLLLLGLQLCGWVLPLVVYRRELALPSRGVGNDRWGVPALALVWVLVPLSNYLLTNTEFFSIRTGVLFVGCLLVLPATALLIARSLEHRYWRAEIAVPLVISCFYVFYTWPAATWALRSSAEDSILPHLLTLVVVSALLVTLYSKARLWFAPIGAVMLAATIVGAALPDDEPQDPEDFLSDLDKDRPISLPDALATKPDIYFLVYDAYVGSNLLRHYGIENRPQEQFLARSGFSIYDRVYTLIGSSIGSMSTVLNMSRAWSRNRDIIAGKSRVNRYLDSMGYKTHYALSPFMTMGSPLLGDHHYPMVDEDSTYGIQTLLRGIAIGEFKYELIYESEFTHENFLREKRQILSADTAEPKFLYAHSPLPGHSQNSGTCRPDETELFEERLQEANVEMRDDVAAILELGLEAVIVIAGDHGPYLTGDCSTLSGLQSDDITALHLADRNGAFLAIHWPESAGRRYDDIRILQDLFFSIFATLGSNPELFEDRLDTTSLSPFRNAIRDGVITGGPGKGSAIY